jgi:hypothetical protein
VIRLHDLEVCWQWRNWGLIYHTAGKILSGLPHYIGKAMPLKADSGLLEAELPERHQWMLEENLTAWITFERDCI